MNLLKLPPSDTRYQNQFGHIDIQHFTVYTGQTPIGKVSEVLLDEAKNYYLSVETGSWLSRRSMILPLRQFQIAPAQHQISLPKGTQPIAPEPSSAPFQFKDVEGEIMPPIELSAPLESSAPLEFPVVTEQEVTEQKVTEQEVTVQSAHQSVQLNPSEIPSSTASHYPAMPAAAPIEEEIIQLLEERLVIDRAWRKAGEVVVRKIIETRLVEVPVRREKLVVEQISPDRRQLASIDLPLSSDSAVLNSPVSTEALHHVSVSITTAHRILEKLQASPELRQTRVKMQFENPNLQSQYQGWLEEHSLHPNL